MSRLSEQWKRERRRPMGRLPTIQKDRSRLPSRTAVFVWTIGYILDRKIRELLAARGRNANQNRAIQHAHEMERVIRRKREALQYIHIFRCAGPPQQLSIPIRDTAPLKQP